MLKAIIADDNKCERLILSKFLNRFSDMVSVEAEAEDGVELLREVNRIHPQIVFLDIDMPQMNGLEAAMEIADINPQTYIIFITAHHEFMKDAIEVYAFDYVTKPIDFDRLEKTIKRISSYVDNISVVNHNESMIEVNSPVMLTKKRSKIIIQNGDKVIFKNMNDIVMVTRSDRKTDICTIAGIVKTNEPLEKIEALLGDEFFRCHKGYIINTDRIAELLPWGKKTLMVRFENYNDTALMTMDKFKIFKRKYCME